MRKVFDIEDKQIFAANVDGKLIEMHMQEERKDIVGSVQKIREMFDFLRPVLVDELRTRSATLVPC